MSDRRSNYNQNNQSFQETQQEDPQAQNYDENGNYNDKKKPKIRPLPPRRDMPTDPDELIEYLKERLDAAEDTINDSIAAFDKQKEKTKKLRKELDEKTRELEELRSIENRTLSEKVQQELKKTLEKASEEKLEAEEAQRALEMQVIERDMMIGELDWNVRVYHSELAQKDRELDELHYRIREQDSLIENLNSNINSLQNENSNKAKKIEDLSRDLEEMRGVIFKLSDVRNVLNRVFTVNDLTFSQRKEKLGSLAGSMELNPSTHNLLPKKNFEVEHTLDPTKEKKPVYATNEDDFWYANPNQNYAQDFGGRAKNYNEQYNYNTIQNLKMHPDAPSPQSEGENGKKYGKATPTTKLPKINPGKGEYLYRANEFLDEIGNASQSKLTKKK